MDLILKDAVVLGVCLNISESGLRGTFSHSVPAGAEGLITLYNGEHSFQIHARVDGLKEDEARVSFRFDSEQERNSLRTFLKHLAATSSKRS